MLKFCFLLLHLQCIIYLNTLKMHSGVDIPELAAAAEEYSLPGLLWAVLGHRDKDAGVNERNRLASSLAPAIGDPSYSDVSFIPNSGRPISTHRCILQARSSYFSAMLESGMRESAGKWQQYSCRTAVYICTPHVSFTLQQ